MAIDDKPTAAWREADLQALCDERRRETPRLEFKQELSLEKESAKSEAERDVAGMANAGGGHILFGVMESEEADGSKVASSLNPLTDGVYTSSSTTCSTVAVTRVSHSNCTRSPLRMAASTSSSRSSETVDLIWQTTTAITSDAISGFGR